MKIPVFFTPLLLLEPIVISHQVSLAVFLEIKECNISQS